MIHNSNKNEFIPGKRELYDGHFIYKSTVDLLLSTLKLLYICELWKKEFTPSYNISTDIDWTNNTIQFKTFVIYSLMLIVSYFFVNRYLILVIILTIYDIDHFLTLNKYDVSLLK